jgi:16S rRNA (cytidine1402-2'-O)-methyltransferase
VAAWADEGGTVVPIPGASAALAAVVASGLAGPRWSFEGFLPRTGRDRRQRLARIAADERASVIFEAPTRLAATLRDLAAACGGERPAAVCRELTKLHEQVVRGSLHELAAAIGVTIPARGEIVIVVAGSTATNPRDVLSTLSPDQARARVAELVAGGMRRADAAKRISAETGLPRRSLYET